MSRFILFIITAFVYLNVHSQAKAPEKTSKNTNPKLIVGIVVDQMRIDYLSRFWNRFGEGGFKRLVNNGFYCKNTHYNYIPTFTGPGHCSIYTGATPSLHGIIANDWYNKETGKMLYCTEDVSVKPVGSSGKAGYMSPQNQLSTTIGDELKLFTNGKSKVFAVALKDRAAILPAGHSANAAFWFDDASGNFISSSWYLNNLPDWLIRFNEKKLPKTYLEKGWNTLYSIETYTASLSDDNDYETAPNKKEKPVFPYDYSTYLSKNNYSIVKASPWGNTLTKDIAIECLKNESLGKGDVCDMLCVSFSSPDIIGHSYGLRAVEIEDVYLRLDKELEELLNALDKETGKDNYTLFLTADHAGADVPNYLKDLKIPAGYINASKLEKDIKLFCKNYFGDTLINSVSNEQVFLDEQKITTLKLDKEQVEKNIAAELLKRTGISEAFTSSEIKNNNINNRSTKTLLTNGYNQKRSGNVFFTYLPAWIDYVQKGTTHGSGYPYDTHVPLIFFGKGIKKGVSLNYIAITEIAPTISALLSIPFPNGCMANPVSDVLDR